MRTLARLAFAATLTLPLLAAAPANATPPVTATVFFPNLIVDAQFAFAPDMSFHDAALATVASAQHLYGTSAANATRAAFEARGLL